VVTGLVDNPAGLCHSRPMPASLPLALLPLARDPTDLPGVKLTGLVIGALLLIVAIRWIFGKK
jgi:hypothetical protein